MIFNYGFYLCMEILHILHLVFWLLLLLTQWMMADSVCVWVRGATTTKLTIDEIINTPQNSGMRNVILIEKVGISYTTIIFCRHIFPHFGVFCTLSNKYKTNFIDVNGNGNATEKSMVKCILLKLFNSVKENKSKTLSA